jgi:protein-L-isoaspartate(D-aspartate) O-methyltransferase
MFDFADARRMMVDGQLRTNEVTDSRLLEAFGTLPREQFVPPELAQLAYLDRDLALSDGTPERPARCMLKPMTLARMIHALDLDPQDRVLDVACGMGYSAAVLARIAGHVVALEDDPELAAQAGRALRQSGVQNVTIRTDRLAAGAAEDAPFNAILINGAVEIMPEAYARQLADGGRLVCLERNGAAGKAVLYRSMKRELRGRAMFDAWGPALRDFAKPAEFVF